MPREKRSGASSPQAADSSLEVQYSLIRHNFARPHMERRTRLGVGDGGRMHEHGRMLQVPRSVHVCFAIVA